MLRITEQDRNEAVIRLRLDGSITDASFSELECAIAAHDPATGKTTIIDMGGVDFMSGEAARRIVQFSSERVRIINCSPFIITLLQSFQDKESRHETGM
jgi:anti-anti-sigma regulatory factor